MQNTTKDLSLGGVPTPARRRYAVRAALVLTAAAAFSPVLATAASAAPGAAIVQQGEDGSRILPIPQPKPDLTYGPVQPKPTIVLNPDLTVCQPLPQQPCGPIVADPDPEPDPNPGPVGPTDLAVATDIPDDPTPTPPTPTPSPSADPADPGTGTDTGTGTGTDTGTGNAAPLPTIPADDPTLAPIGADNPDQDAAPAPGSTQEYPVLQIAGLGLLGAVTTIALMVSVLRRRATETR